MLVAASFDEEGPDSKVPGAKSPDSAEWSWGSGDGLCVDDIRDGLVPTEQLVSRKRSGGSLVEASERRSKHARCSPCSLNVRTL